MAASIKNMDKRTKYAVFGFMRDAQRILSSSHGTNNAFYNIPDLVMNQCLLFYGMPNIPYRGKFVKQNASKYITVVNDHEIVLSTDSYCSAKMDTPISMGQNMNCCWQIMMDHDDDTGLDSCDMFGVVSNECNNIGTCPWGHLTDSYGISAVPEGVWLGTSGNFQKDEKYQTRIEKNQMVKMELNCQTSKLVFKIKDKIIYTIQLPKREAWYPAVSLTFGQDNYRAKFITLE